MTSREELENQDLVPPSVTEPGCVWLADSLGAARRENGRCRCWWLSSGAVSKVLAPRLAAADPGPVVQVVL